MSLRRLQRTLIALALCAAISACDESEPATTSPPVTVPGANPGSSAPSGGSPGNPAQPDSEPSAEDPAAAQAPGGAAAPAELPQGTPEQKEALMQAKMAFLQNRLVEAEDLFKGIARSEPVSGESVS